MAAWWTLPTGGVVVDERPASGEEAEIFDALDGFADPALAHEGVAL